MKNLIGILSVTLVLFFAGISDVSAQWSVIVSWSDSCGGCPGPGGYEYYVCCTITDICDPQVVYNDCQIKSSGIYSHTFNVGEICDVDQHEACFIVYVSVIKRCIIGHYKICTDSDHNTVNCASIYEGLVFPLILQ
jgi:hypothetical protein